MDKNNKIIIYCDMDGVLCNFYKQFFDLVIAPNEKYVKELNIEVREYSFDEYVKFVDNFVDKYGLNTFWKEIYRCGVEFWSEMPWLDNGKELWSGLNDIKKEYKDIIILNILSAPATFKESETGKIQWCNTNLSPKPDKIILERNKEKYADEHSILIDDYGKNINKFKSAGGHTVKYYYKDYSNVLINVENIVINIINKLFEKQ